MLMRDVEKQMDEETDASRAEPSPDDRESVVDDHWRIPFESRDEVLEIATILALTEHHPEQMLDTIRMMANAHRLSIHHTGEAFRGETAARLHSVLSERDEKRALRKELVSELAAKRDKEVALVHTASELRLKELELQTARAQARGAALDAELVRIDIERDRALLGGVDAADALAAAQRAWNDSAPARSKSVSRLEDELAIATRHAEEVQTRVAAATPPMMTHTVARFLVWAGYAAVPATGAILSNLLDRAPADSTTVLEALRQFVNSMPATGTLERFLTLALLLSVMLLFVASVAVGCDWVIGRFHRKWGEPEVERSSLELTPTRITRQSYVRLLASVPFLLAAALAASFLAAVPSEHDHSGLLKSIIPAITTAFIGSAISLLSTAAFTLYILKIMERRDGMAQHRRPWELRIPIAILLVAIVVSIPIFETSSHFGRWSFSDRPVWAAWSLFMLLGSLSFAYGLIHNGLFREVHKNDRRIRALEQRIRMSYEPPTLATLRAVNTWVPRGIARRYAEERSEWESVARRLRIVELLGFGLDSLPASIVVKTRLLQRSARIQLRPPAGGAFLSLDQQAGPEIVQAIEHLRSIHETLTSDIRVLDANIEEKRRRASFEELDRVEKRRTCLLEDLMRSQPADRATEARSYLSEDEMLLRVKAAIASASVVRPAFAPISHDAAHSAEARGVRMPDPLTPA